MTAEAVEGDGSVLNERYTACSLFGVFTKEDALDEEGWSPLKSVSEGEPTKPRGAFSEEDIGGRGRFRVETGDVGASQFHPIICGV